MDPTGQPMPPPDLPQELQLGDGQAKYDDQGVQTMPENVTVVHEQPSGTQEVPEHIESHAGLFELPEAPQDKIQNGEIIKETTADGTDTIEKKNESNET